MTLLSLIVLLLLLPLQINGFGISTPPRNTGNIQTLVLPVPRPVPLPQPSRPIAITDDPPSSLLFDLLPLLFSKYFEY